MIAVIYVIADLSALCGGSGGMVTFIPLLLLPLPHQMLALAVFFLCKNPVRARFKSPS